MTKKNIVPAGGSESDEEYDLYGDYIEKRIYRGKPRIENVEELLKNACIMNNVSEIERVLNSGSVNINSYLCNSWTALMYAAFHGSFDAVKYLLRNGADPSIQYDCHNVVMCICNCQKVSNEIDLLNCLKLLVDSVSIDINSKDRNGISALMYACSNGWLKIVEFLIDRGADIEMKDNHNGETALFFAVRYNHVNVVKFLLSRNANKDVTDKEGRTLHVIAENKNMVDILSMLDVDHGKHLEVYYAKECTYWDKVMAEVENGYNSDVQMFLETLSMEVYIDYFNSNKITFKSLLTGNKDQSVQTAVTLTPHRQLLATGLKCFHTQDWSNYCLDIKKDKMNGEHIAQALAAVLRQLNILDASIMYLETYGSSLNPQKGQEALTFLMHIRTTESKIFEILEKKTRIGQVDYIGPHKLRNSNRKITLTDKVFVASVVILVLLRVF